MAGDHHEYVRPKTDGTFGLRTQWSRLSKSQLGELATNHSVVSSAQQAGLPDLEPLTREALETKTLRQWWYWQEWRRTHPLAHLHPRYMWNRYLWKNTSAKLPNHLIAMHWFAGAAAFGFVVQYANNSTSLSGEEMVV